MSYEPGKFFDKGCIKQIVREELAKKEMQDLFLSIWTKNNSNEKIKTVAENAAQNIVSRYLESHLKGEVMLILTENLSTLITPLIKQEIADKLSSLSGVTHALDQHKKTVDAIISNMERSFQNVANGHQNQLQHISDSYLYTYTQTLEANANALVGKMVADNGMIINGFKDHLAEQNRTAFENFARESKDTIRRIDTENQTLKNLNWILLAGIGVLGLIYFTRH